MAVQSTNYVTKSNQQIVDPHFCCVLQKANENGKLGKGIAGVF